MVKLEKGSFYSEPGGEIYYYDGNSLYCPGNKNALNPVTSVHQGLSSFHDLDVDVRKFEKVNPLEHLMVKENDILKLVEFIKEYSK
jgi:hypothetical protein